MTVYFDLDRISFTVSGVKHDFGFKVASVHVQGSAANIRKLLSGDALERIEEAAAEAAIDPIDCPPPPHVMAVELAEGGRS